jgi:hypothetical protein
MPEQFRAGAYEDNVSHSVIVHWKQSKKISSHD